MAEKTLAELLHPTTGIFDPALRFAWTNISDSEFVSYWGGRPIRVAPGKTVELQHHLAVKFTRELTDKILIGDAKADEVEFYKNNPNTGPNVYRSPKGLSLGIPQARQPYEERMCRLLAVDEESPEVQTLRAQLREELLAHQNGDARAAVPEPVSVPVAHEPGKLPEAFADLDAPKKEEPKKPIKVKEL